MLVHLHGRCYGLQLPGGFQYCGCFSDLPKAMKTSKKSEPNAKFNINPNSTLYIDKQTR